MEVNIYFLLALVVLATVSLPGSAITNTASGQTRERRSFKALTAKKIPVIGSLFAGKKLPIVGSLFGEEETPEIPHLGKYPLWKIHRYNGIELRPVPLPGDHTPLHPVFPIVPEEAPSIVNVPDPNYAIHTVTPPPTEYGLPHNHAPYSPQVDHSGPYPPPNIPSGPYPAENSPSGPYSPSNSPPGPYPSTNIPTEPHSVIYNAQLPSRAPRGPATASASAQASSSGFSSSDSSANVQTSYAAEHNVEDLGNLQDLHNVLPPELYQMMQQYISTPAGRERVGALLGIAEKAKKLKRNTARSIQGIFQKFFGGAGGSTNVALQSGTYTNIPAPYPAPQGIFNSFGSVGTGISGDLLPSLPKDPELPEIPGLQATPPVPGLPHIHLPAISQVPASHTGNHYVSIRLPQAPELPPIHHSFPEQHAPSYSLPAETYGPPFKTTGVSAESYNAHAHTYSAPQIPSTSYGVPSGPVYPYQPHTPATTPYHAPQQSYEVPTDSFSAGSEINVHTEPLQKGLAEEVVNGTHEFLNTTKLHRVQNSQSFLGEDMRIYLDSDHPAAFTPSQEIDINDNQYDFGEFTGILRDQALRESGSYRRTVQPSPVTNTLTDVIQVLIAFELEPPMCEKP
ncbi:verprolin-like [Homalodisca vitripennis]|uniref:verprolin-like n=1 Tax=Homalodisca vitripennis TaxID=197043 RepID=UPI001EEC9C36|nr:verprolin-like [Homalodisca vitripennis]